MSIVALGLVIFIIAKMKIKNLSVSNTVSKTSAKS